MKENNSESDDDKFLESVFNLNRSPLAEMSAQLHEFYVELKMAGFSRKESLYLTACLIKTGLSSDEPS